MSGPHTEFVAWAAGRIDALGLPFSAWKLARYNADGSVMRDANGRQIFETQAEYLERQAGPINPPASIDQMELFA